MVQDDATSGNEKSSIYTANFRKSKSSNNMLSSQLLDSARMQRSTVVEYQDSNQSIQLTVNRVLNESSSLKKESTDLADTNTMPPSTDL